MDRWSVRFYVAYADSRRETKRPCIINHVIYLHHVTRTYTQGNLKSRDVPEILSLLTLAFANKMWMPVGRWAMVKGGNIFGV